MGSAGLGPRKAGVVAPAEGVDLVVTGSGQIRGRVVDGDSGRAVAGLPAALPARRAGRHAVRDARGPGARAGPLREGAVPRGGRLLRARGRGGGAVDGRGVRPGLPGGQRRRRDRGRGRGHGGRRGAPVEGRGDRRQGARVAHRPPHPRRHRSRRAVGGRLADGDGAHRRRGRGQRGFDRRRGPLRDRGARPRDLGPHRVAPRLERGDGERRAQGGARRRGHPARKGRLRRGDRARRRTAGARRGGHDRGGGGLGLPGRGGLPRRRRAERAQRRGRPLPVRAARTPAATRSAPRCATSRARPSRPC